MSLTTHTRLRDDAIDARRRLIDHAATITTAGDIPEHDERHAALSAAARMLDDMYSHTTGQDPFVGLAVTLPETGNREWTITDRSQFHGTVKLGDPATGDEHPHWVLLDYALHATSLAAARATQLAAQHPDRTIPARYLVERDDLGDGVWETVVEGDTLTSAASPTALGHVARELEADHRRAGTPGVLYRVTVTCQDRRATTTTPHGDDPDASAPDTEPDWKASMTIPPTMVPTSFYRRHIHVWQDTAGRIYVQIDNSDHIWPATAGTTVGRFASYASDLRFGEADLPAGAGRIPPADATKVATWDQIDGITVHVDPADLCEEAQKFIDPPPAGIDPDAWAVSRDLTPDQIDEELNKLGAALAARRGDPGLRIVVFPARLARLHRLST